MTVALAVAWSVLVVAGTVGRRPVALPSGAVRDRRPFAKPSRTRPPAGVLRALRALRAERARRAAVAAAAPDLVDLFAVAVAAGLNVRLATDAVALRALPGPIRDALLQVRAEVAAGHRLGDALERLPARTHPTDESVRSLTAALVDAERYGTALGPTLDRLAAEARRDRQRRAEEAARRLPVQLLFPLVTCILPAFGLLTVAPLIAGGLRALRL